MSKALGGCKGDLNPTRALPGKGTWVAAAPDGDSWKGLLMEAKEAAAFQTACAERAGRGHAPLTGAPFDRRKFLCWQKRCALIESFLCPGIRPCHLVVTCGSLTLEVWGGPAGL